MKLTKQMFYDGKVVLLKTTRADIDKFVAEHGYPPFGAKEKKKDMLNAITDILESETFKQASTPATPAPPAQKIRANGEVVKFTHDGKDLGMNYMNDRYDRTAAQEAAQRPVASVREERRNPKSSTIANKLAKTI